MSYVDTFQRYVRGLPKAELHAHISGSIRTSTLRELIESHYSSTEAEEKLKICKLRVGDEEDKRDLNECFAMFKVLHHVIDSADILRRITFQSLVDFVYADGACYVELRTTPRAIISPSGESITKREYLEAVCDTIDAFKSAVHAQSHPSEAKVSSATSTNQTSLTVPGPALHFVDAGLLVSIDRSTSLSEAQDTLDLVVKMREEGRCIVGLDFSGNPFSRRFTHYSTVFQVARDKGIPTSIHFAETIDDEDAQAILNFKPERVGHAAVMSPTTFDTLLTHRIPVEICFTSNLACKLHSTVVTHPFHRLLKNNHPLSLSTDDKGIFATTLCKEYYHLLHYPEFSNPSQTSSSSSSSSSTSTTSDAVASTSSTPSATCGCTCSSSSSSSTCETCQSLSTSSSLGSNTLSSPSIHTLLQDRLGLLFKMVKGSVDSWFASNETKAKAITIMQQYHDKFVKECNV